MNFIEVNGVCAALRAVRAAASHAGADPRDGRHAGELGPRAAHARRRSGASCATTRAARACRRRSAARSRIDTMTDDLIALLDALGITGKVALAGTAVGGAIALHTAVRFPRARRGGRSSPARPSASRPIAVPAVLARVEQIETRGPARRRRYAATTAIRRSCAATRQRFAAFRARWLANDPASFARHLPHAGRHGPAAGAAAIKCPVLVIGGDARSRRPPSRWSSRSRRPFPGARSRSAARPGTMRGRADAGAVRRDDDRRVSSDARRRAESLLQRRLRAQDHASPAPTARRRCRAPSRRRSPSPAARRIRRAAAARASIRRNSPYMPGMAIGEPAAIGVDRQAALGRDAPPATNAPPSPFLQKPRSSRNRIVLMVKAS